jgi:FAD/FMN-containing dehydrogenase/Fe-S oxidoreductase
MESFLADLRPVFRGRLSADAAELAVYSTDASPFRIVPAAVACPADAEDAAELLRRAGMANVSVVARGGGTGLAGESLGPGIILDFSTHCCAVLETGSDYVRCQPGATLHAVNTAAATVGRRFAPDPSAPAGTAGGAFATDASGHNAHAFGTVRQHLHAATLLWADGSSSRLPGPSPFDVPLQELFDEFNRPILQHRPRTRFDRCGYRVQDGPLALSLAIGSEGTLGIATELTFKTIPLPGGTAMAAIGFPTFDTAARAGAELRSAAGIVSCDLLDQRMLSLARAQYPAFAVPQIAALLLLTAEGESAAESVAFLAEAVESIRPHFRLGVVAESRAEPSHVSKLRSFRSVAVGGLYSLGRGPRPEAFIEDIAVPPERLAEFAAAVQDVLRSFDLSASILAHPLTGQLHIRPLVDLADAADRAKMWPAAEAIHSLAISFDGTVTGQHGTGLARTPWVERQAGPLWPLYREIKRIFDPKAILNPGKIVGPDPSRPAWPLREPPAKIILPTAVAEASRCTACGDCKSTTGRIRMCPGYRGNPQESRSPRAIAQIVVSDHFQLSSTVHDIAAACIHCGMCKAECRANVDVSGIARELKAAYFAEHGPTRTDAFFARAESLAALAGNFAFSANFLFGSRWGRWAAEKLFGVDRNVLLPKFTHRTFLRRARKLGLTKLRPEAGRKVAYFVDTYANVTDPQIAAAAVAVLQHHGVFVHVPWRQRSSGMARLDAGDAESARERARYNLRTLTPLVRDGYTILCSEPTAALALAIEYPRLLPDDEEAALVARHTAEFTEYLWRLREAGRLKTDFRPVPASVGHHVPCHILARQPDPAGPKLLQLIPQLKLTILENSCSGMAGTFGLRAANRPASRRIGENMLDSLDRPGVLFGSTECGSCRMQMQSAGGKRTLHPAQYLALAYGLMPELERRLKQSLGPRIAT